MSFGDWEEEPTEEEPGESEPKLVYGSPVEFFAEYLRRVYVRQIKPPQACWEARWWENPEALIRMEALWRSWEHLRLDPATGMSVWFRDHLEPHMASLMRSEGPFGRSQETTKRGEPLPHEVPPSGLFPSVN